MKTTVDIAPALLAEAKRVAAEEDTTLREIIEEGLRLSLDRRSRAPRFKLEDASVGGQGVGPDLAEGDWSRIRDLIYEGQGSDSD